MPAVPRFEAFFGERPTRWEKSENEVVGRSRNHAGRGRNWREKLAPARMLSGTSRARAAGLIDAPCRAHRGSRAYVRLPSGSRPRALNPGRMPQLSSHPVPPGLAGVLMIQAAAGNHRHSAEPRSVRSLCVSVCETHSITLL